MHCKKLLPIVIISALLLIGCDRSTGSSNNRVTVQPSLGLIQNAKVRIYAADGKTLLEKGTTGITGISSMSLPTARGPLVIAVYGDTGAVYFDESLGGYISLLPTPVMHAIVPSPLGKYAVTPLTELAYRVAVDQKLFPLTASEVNILNERIRAALAPELNNILTPPTLFSTTTTTGSLDDNQADRYALRLAAMAELGSGQGRPAVSVMNALGSDILDGDDDDIGVIDDLDKNGDALTTPYDPVTLVADINTHLDNFASLYGTAELQAAVANPTEYSDISLTLDFTNIDDGSNFSGCGSGDNPSIPSDFKGRSINLEFERSDAASPYIDEEVVRFTFCTNGQLRLTTNYYVVSSEPTITVIDATMTTYTWRQNGNGMLYEVVAMDDMLFEVNVYADNGALYFGRFVK
jgi:hypothetical protein